MKKAFTIDNFRKRGIIYRQAETYQKWLLKVVAGDFGRKRGQGFDEYK
jgi:hypothetical protein